MKPSPTPSHEDAILPQQPTGAYLCEGTEKHCEYWKRGAWNEPNRESALTCMEQAVNGWKNLAYSLARQAHFYLMSRPGYVEPTSGGHWHVWIDGACFCGAKETTRSETPRTKICKTTGNPCGTDTVFAGQECPGGGPCTGSAVSAIPCNGWVPVEERLPDHDGYIEVLASDAQGNVFSADYWSEDKTFWPANGKGEYWASAYDDVTHWMPMPKRTP